MSVSKIVGVVVALLVFSALAGTVLTNLEAINVSGFAIVSDMPALVALFFMLGAGVILVGKELGIIKI